MQLIKVKNSDGIFLPIYWEYVGKWQYSSILQRLSEYELDTAKKYFELIGKITMIC